MRHGARALALFALLAGCGDKTDHDAGIDAATDPLADGSTSDGSSRDGATSSSDGAIASTDMAMGRYSSGCGTMPANPTSYTATTTDGNGAQRMYDVFVPSPYDASTPLALTFVFHGGGETQYNAEGYGVQMGTGASAASLFVFPLGVYDPEGSSSGWNARCNSPDMPFFDNMLYELETQYCIDTTRVFAAGFSEGCDMSTGLACCRGDRIRAIGAASCTDYYDTLSDYTTFKDAASCPPPLHTAIRFTHDKSGGDAGYAAPAFITTSQLYQHWLACTPQSPPADTCTTFAGCDDPFIECPYTNLGHMLPSNWGPDTWAFFASFD